MKKVLVSLMLAGLFITMAPSASADVMRHARGEVIVNKGTVYFVGSDTLYPFPSMAVFKSYGHELKDVKPANAADMALKVGPVAALNNRPFGHLDEINATGYVHGWVVDRDNLNTTDGFTIWATFDEPYRTDGNYKYSMVTAPTSGYLRSDVNAALGLSGNYGFALAVIDELRDGLPHTMYVYAVDKESPDKPVQLIGSPKQFTVSAQINNDDDEDAFSDQFNDSMIFIGVLSIVEKLHYYKQINGVFPSTLAGAGVVLEDIAVEPYGVCSQSDMNFVYTPTSNYQNFTLKYCLGTDTIYSGFSSGSASDSPLISLKESFKVGVNILNYTMLEEILWLLDQVGTSAEQVRDARRVAEVYQLRSALELYYDAHNQYPVTLSDLVPTQISSLPVAPLPVDGWCTEENNTYTYQQWYNGESYDLFFCLGGNTGSYEPGLNVITP